MKRIVLSILLIASFGILARAAWAFDSGACERFTTCLLPSTGHVPGTDSLDSRPSTVTETNSLAIFNVFLIDPDGTVDDTGTEVCALVGMDCVDTVEIDEGADVSADEKGIIAGTCSTDYTGKIAFVFCN